MVVKSDIFSKIHVACRLFIIGPGIYKTPGHFYVDLKTPSLHGNFSEFGAKDINLKMSCGLIAWR